MHGGQQLDTDPSWLKAMKNASAKHHIDRLTALKMLTQAELEEAIARIDGSWMERMAKDAYLYALYSAQTNIGLGFNAPNIEMVIRSAKKPWTPDGMEFVERKAVNNAKLVQKVQRELTQAAITGEAYTSIAERVTKSIALTQYEAERIIRTESAHIETEASIQAYKDCSIDRYQVLASLDRKTCEICAEMDLTIWKVSEKVDGLNVPPFHPNCRCTTIAYFDDPELQATRAAKNADGRTVFVDGDMSYNDWAAKFDPDDNESGLEIITFKPAKTLEEAQEYAQKYIASYFMDKTFKGVADFKGVSLDHANEINKALTEVFERFPEMDKLSGIKTVSPTSAKGKKAFKDGADALFSYDPIQHGIYINKEVLKNTDSFDAYLRRSQEAWDIVMKNIDKLSGPQKDLAERYAMAGRDLVSGNSVKGLFTHELGHHVQWTMLDSKTTNDIGSRMKQFAPKLSGYAQASGSEYFAESFVAYMRGEKQLLDPEYVRYLNGASKKSKLIVLSSDLQMVAKPISFTASDNHAIIATSKQLGKKLGKHCKDYGLDPSNSDSREWLTNHIQDIIQNHTAKYEGSFMGQGSIGSTGVNNRGKVLFYELGGDIVVVSGDDKRFVSLLKGGINNTSVKKARDDFFRGKR